MKLIRKWKSMLLILSLLIISGAPSSAAASYDKNRGPNNTSRIVLTYDDCPNSLKQLRGFIRQARDLNVGTVLAPTGNCVRSFQLRYGVHIPTLMRQHGQYVINHSVTHPDMRTLSYNEIVRELGKPGVTINYGRPPFGATNSRVNQAYADVGMRQWLWNVDTRDWEGKTRRQVVRYVVNNSRSGDTVLLHMQHKAFNRKALRAINRGLAERGYDLCRAYPGRSPTDLPHNLNC